MSSEYKTDAFISRTLADWACKLNYEDLSQDAVEAAKRFWFDSLGCALGGSQQEDARILLGHHREMALGSDAATQRRSDEGDCSCFVSGFRTNPVDAALLNSHMVRATRAIRAT